MTNDNVQGVVKPGWHIWLVGILGVLWNGFGSLDFTMTASRNEAWLAPYPEEMLNYLFAMPWWTWAMWAVGVFGGLAGSALLLMKRSLAVPALAVSFVAALVSIILGQTAKDAPVMEGTEFMPFVILGIAIGLLAYAWWQFRSGVLR